MSRWQGFAKKNKIKKIKIKNTVVKILKNCYKIKAIYLKKKKGYVPTLKFISQNICFQKDFICAQY